MGVRRRVIARLPVGWQAIRGVIADYRGVLHECLYPPGLVTVIGVDEEHQHRHGGRGGAVQQSQPMDQRPAHCGIRWNDALTVSRGWYLPNH